MKNFKPNSWFLPQTVIIIGTYDADGTPNAMNAAWSGTWDQDEISISMGNHQTTVNLNANPDFTVAFATKELLVPSDYVGIVSGKKAKDKVAKTGWTVEKGQQVNAPVFTDFPLTMECRIEKKFDESETEKHYYWCKHQYSDYQRSAQPRYLARDISMRVPK